MSSWLRNWFENLTQTRKFHPSWILLGVAVSIVLAAVVWGIAELLTHVEPDGLPRAETRIPPSRDAVQKGGAPATIEPPVVPRETRRKTIHVRFFPRVPAEEWERIPATPAAGVSPAKRAASLRRVT